MAGLPRRDCSLPDTTHCFSQDKTRPRALLPHAPITISTPKKTARSRASLIGTLCASPARPSHAVRQAQLFHSTPGNCSSSPVQDEILGRPGGVPVDRNHCHRPGLPRVPDDSPLARSLPGFPSDDSWSDDRLYKDAPPRTSKSDPSYLNKWLQSQCPPSPNVQEGLQTNMAELCLSPAGSRRLPNSFLGDRHNLDAPANRNVREYDGAVANFTLSKIKTALHAYPEHLAALPAGMDAQLSHQLPVSHPSRPSLPPRETYVSGGLFPMSALQTPADDQDANLDVSVPTPSLPHRFKRASLPPGIALDKPHKPEQTPFVDASTSPSKRRPKRPCRLSSNPNLTAAAALSAIAAIHGHGSASTKIPVAPREDPLPYDLTSSRVVLSTGSDSSSLPSPPRLHSTILRGDSPATPLMPPATPHLLPVSSSPLPLPSSPPFLRSALRGAGAHHAVSPRVGGSVSASSTRFSSPSPLAPRRRGYTDAATRFSPTRHGLSPDVVLFRGDSAARAKLRERRLGRKRGSSWGDDCLFAREGGGLGLGTDEGPGNMDSGEEADEEDEGEADAMEAEGDEGDDDGGVRVALDGSGAVVGEGVEWVFHDEGEVHHSGSSVLSPILIACLSVCLSACLSIYIYLSTSGDCMRIKPVDEMLYVPCPPSSLLTAHGGMTDRQVTSLRFTTTARKRGGEEQRQRGREVNEKGNMEVGVEAVVRMPRESKLEES
ncbi:hypothetical protein BKA80DRAFT_257346 [Phyllosticta citrichinensis]